jgi:hypothetical protein
MDPSAAGPAIIFVLLIAATMIVGTYVYAYTAHCFLTVFEQTASGNDEVVWPSGPFLDWLWEAVYLLWLSAIWLGPIVLAVRAAANASSALVVAAIFVWLFFPFTLLSSMGATSRWTLLSPQLIRRLLGQRFGSLLLFYLHSGPVLAAVAGMTYLTFFAAGGAWFLVLTATGTATALFVFARQLGRLAHLVMHTDEPTPARPNRERPRRRRVRAAAHDPWSDEQNRPRQPSELPPVMSPSEGPITGYDVNYGDRPVQETPPLPRKRPPDLDDVPYELHGSPNDAPPRGPMPKFFNEPSEDEIALARGGRAMRPPKNPWAAGVYNFPLYSKSLPHLIAVSGGLAVLGLLIAAMLGNNPG